MIEMEESSEAKFEEDFGSGRVLWILPQRRYEMLLELMSDNAR